jgi:hypothetical protein
MDSLGTGRDKLRAFLCSWGAVEVFLNTSTSRSSVSKTHHRVRLGAEGVHFLFVVCASKCVAFQAQGSVNLQRPTLFRDQFVSVASNRGVPQK